MHYHEEQEEVFYAIEGTLHVETPEEEYRVESEQVLAVEPDNLQEAFDPDDATEPVHVLAIGAPSFSVLGRNDGLRYDPDGEEEGFQGPRLSLEDQYGGRHRLRFRSTPPVLSWHGPIRNSFAQVAV